jgi:hypothetical protein
MVTLQMYVLLSVAKMDVLCEFLFLDNSVLCGLVIEEAQRDTCVHDIYSKRSTEGQFNKFFQTLRKIGTIL